MRRMIAIAVVVVLMLMAAPICAQTARTTPVEVKNPVSIDSTTNTVKAQQLGLWTVNVGGTPSVAQSGSWNVGIVGTPNFNIANTPTVKIDATSNTVKIDSIANAVKISTNHASLNWWTGSQVVAANSSLWSQHVTCSGYKEARIFLRMSSGTPNAQVKVFLQTKSPSNYDTSLGSVDFATSSDMITNHANYTTSPGHIAFSIPIFFDVLALYVQNGNSTPITIDGDRSWIFLVN